MRFVGLAFLITLVVGCQSTGSGQDKDQPYTNHLINENSPYLLQHAHNPVDWYPWGEAALLKAKEENKMLLISVGYSACHWCHVMEHESFEDTTVARMMNEHFVNIKVDREERPDVDDVYMTACQLATDRGCGWPLNAFALPDGRPVWAGTYFPKKNWIELLEYFVKLYQDEPGKLEEYAAQLVEGITSTNLVAAIDTLHNFRHEIPERLANVLVSQVDPLRGGRKGAPKFPSPSNYEFLLAWHATSGDAAALRAANTTLTELAKGGIYDHLGGGFARYSTDERWHIPHFEKMLYDNAQLVSLFAKGYQLTGDERYRRTLTETLEFVKRDLTDSNGGFYSSLDADSEGEEGKFYVWTAGEIDSVLQDEQSRKLFKNYYNVKASGNWEEEKNVLYVDKRLENVAGKLDMDAVAARNLLDEARAKLLAVRELRVYPGKDDKILTSWNALMLQGYIDAYRAVGEEIYRTTAIRNAAFLLDHMRKSDGGLMRNFKGDQAKINAFLDDYAQLGLALIGLYEITFDGQWLMVSQELADYAITHFYDPESKLFYYTSDLDPPLVARKKELDDNVIPASNSAAARWLLRLGTYLYKPAYTEKAKGALTAMSTRLENSEYPSAQSNWAQLYLEMLHPPYEVAIVGEDWDDKRKQMQKKYLPNAWFLGGKTEGNLELLKGKRVEDETFIYVCQNKVCKLPVSDAAEALQLLNK